MSLSSAAERVTTLERWRKLLGETSEKGLPGSQAYATLAHELEQARVDAIFARAKEENGGLAQRGTGAQGQSQGVGPDHVCDAQTCGFRGPCAQRGLR